MNRKKLSLICLLAVLFFFGSALVYFYLNCQFWTHLDTRGFKSLVEYQGKRIVGYRGRQVLAHKSFLTVMRRMDDYAERSGVVLIITQGYRPPGKNLKKVVVPPAITSNHLAGHAIDFNVRFEGTTFESKDLVKSDLRDLPMSVEAFIETLRKDKTMRWGGDFSSEDPVHVDDGLNQKHMEKWEAHSRACLDDYCHAVPKWKTWFTGSKN